MATKYKVWVHLEKIVTDKKGHEKYINLDDIELPMPAGEFAKKKEALAQMETIYQIHHQTI